MQWHRTDSEDMWEPLGQSMTGSMQIEAPERFQHPCGFVPLRERHRVKAGRTVTNRDDRHCRIGKVRLK